MMWLTVFTPSGTLAQERVEEIVAPGLLGEFCVLAGHLPLLYVLKPGVVRYKVEGGENKAFVIAGGYFEINERGEASLLAPKAYFKENLDSLQIESSMRRIDQDLRSEGSASVLKEDLLKEQEFYLIAKQFMGA